MAASPPAHVRNRGGCGDEDGSGSAAGDGGLGGGTGRGTRVVAGGAYRTSARQAAPSRVTCDEGATAGGGERAVSAVVGTASLSCGASVLISSSSQSAGVLPTRMLGCQMVSACVSEAAMPVGGVEADTPSLPEALCVCTMLSRDRPSAMTCEHGVSVVGRRGTAAETLRRCGGMDDTSGSAKVPSPVGRLRTSWTLWNRLAWCRGSCAVSASVSLRPRLALA